MGRLIILATLLTALGLAAACGGASVTIDGDEPTPDGAGEPAPSGESEIAQILANSELVVGPNRFAFGLIDEEGQPIHGEPGTSVRFRFSHQRSDGSRLEEERDARFVWAIPNQTGLWAADVDFAQPGNWRVQVLLTRNGEETALPPYTFEVRSESLIPTVGDPAIPSANATLADVPDIKQISTDPDPEPALYQMTVGQALQAGRPLVVVFATPAFCQTRFCGPLVDNVKEIRPEFADRVNFIHIEPYQLDGQGQLVTGAGGYPIAAAPMAEWNLQTVPWVFVIDGQGRITARFEGAVSPGELREAIQKTLS